MGKRVDIIGDGKKGTKNEIDILREKVKPYTKEEIELLQQNTFNSPWSEYKKYNGMKFKVLYEHFDDDSREPFGNEYSAAWINDDGDVCSDRYFDIELENGVTITAELEELDNWYVTSNQM
jgi:hypothetical protein